MGCEKFDGDATVAVIGGDIVWHTADPFIHATNEIAALPDFQEVYTVREPCEASDIRCHAIRRERPLPDPQPWMDSEGRRVAPGPKYDKTIIKEK